MTVTLNVLHSPAEHLWDVLEQKMCVQPTDLQHLCDVNNGPKCLRNGSVLHIIKEF